MEPTNLRILHVTECHAGGVSRAIRSRVEATTGFEHFLLWDGEEEPTFEAGFQKTMKFRTNAVLSRVQEFEQVCSIVTPDIVHSHSSWAGVYTRMRGTGIPVVYEPHCFKFDDPSIGRLSHTMFRGAEKALARRTAVFGALSAHEEELMKGLSSVVPVVRVPNVPIIKEGLSSKGPSSRSSVAMAGRLCNQKDPEFFLQVIKCLRGLGDDIKPVWVGDGEPRYRTMLENAGIRVTSWLDLDDLQRELKDAVYLHTAAYEGFPLSILDAAACGAPIVGRSIPAFDGLPIYQAGDPNSLAKLVSRVRATGPLQDKALAANRVLLSEYNTYNQALQIKRLYQVARGGNK